MKTRLYVGFNTGHALPDQDLGPQQSMQLLDTCDGRIQALMAEADFLSQPVLSDSTDASGFKLEGEIREAFASVLIESGASHKWCQHSIILCMVIKCAGLTHAKI